MSASNLERYLNDHLAGAAGALGLVEDLSRREDLDGAFFRDLHEEIFADRELLVQLMNLANLRENSLLQLAGNVTGKVGRLKLMWEGIHPGELGLFEALEMLSLGIQGKRLLWYALAEVAGDFPAWAEVDFAALAGRAKTQRDKVEDKRRAVARQALSN